MPEPSPSIVVVGGPNGAGKSTTAESLLKGTLAVDEFVNADVVARGLSGFASEGAAVAADHAGADSGARGATAGLSDPRDHQALELRVREIERRVDGSRMDQNSAHEMRPAPAAYDAPAAPPITRTALTSDAGDPAASEARLEALERRVAALEYALGGPQLVAMINGAHQGLRREEEIRAAKTLLADPGASASEQLVAHSALRRVADAYTPQMVQDLAYVGTHDPDPEVRSGVWRNFDGATRLPELVPHLLHALSKDGDPSVRDEAAETLGNYLDDPLVLAGLKYAIEYDESMQVRRKASRALSEWSGTVSERSRRSSPHWRTCWREPRPWGSAAGSWRPWRRSSCPFRGRRSGRGLAANARPPVSAPRTRQPPAPARPKNAT